MRGVAEQTRLLAAATILSGALLLFEVEPLIAKAILPWFGGSAQVWTTCLLFFQAALLGGYLYAHLLSSRVAPRWQWRVHATLLGVSLFFLPIIPAEQWKPVGGEDPLWLILGLLSSTIGLPFVLLSATSPLVQAWLARPVAGVVRPPYRLFALSNLGSLLALLAYPVLVEPYLAVRSQAVMWSLGYGGFAVLCAVTACSYREGKAEPRHAADAPPWRRQLLWLGLAAAPSGLLLAMTNFMLQNVAAIPLFWIVPLALYLASFVFAFNNPRWYAQPHWYLAFVIAVGVLLVAVAGLFAEAGLVVLPLLALTLFVLCYVCHSELALAKPAPCHLTSYYLLISSGGAAGGLFVAVIAPSLFNATYELSLLAPFTILVVLLAAALHYRAWSKIRPRLLALCGAALVALSLFVMVRVSLEMATDAVLVTRNFYGALRVEDLALDATTPARKLVNGNVLHGIERIDSAHRRDPMSYYAPVSGIGRLLDTLGKEGPLRVGVIGLGVGTLAAYGRKGDDYRFYEINPAVENIAAEQFWYLRTNPAHQSIILGDGRLALEREAPQRFDVLVVDAFIGDSIPMHLLTKEAFALYWRHLKPNGVLAVHVSNRFVNLAPIAAEAAAATGKTARLVITDTRLDGGVAHSEWLLATSRSTLFAAPALRLAKPVAIAPALKPWSDDYSSIWSVLRL